MLSQDMDEAGGTCITWRIVADADRTCIAGRAGPPHKAASDRTGTRVYHAYGFPILTRF